MPLERLEKEAAESQEKLIAFLLEETDRSESTLRRAVGGAAMCDVGAAMCDVGNGIGDKAGANSDAPTDTDLAPRKKTARRKSQIPNPKSHISSPASQTPSHALLAACDHDPRLAARIAPFATLLREDTFARPIVILPDSLYVAPGSDRRSTGTHYTPRSLTEPIVQHTLEPLVYHGPAEGLPRGEWRLKAPREILALKICDLAMGSGAFLVGVCRYLSARLVEAWEHSLRSDAGGGMGDGACGDVGGAMWDLGNASPDHGVASPDHGVASSDHGVASSDHEVASSNHGVAPSDHGVASSNHGVASSNHGVAPSDHGVAPSDHGDVPPDRGVASSLNREKHPANREATHPTSQISNPPSQPPPRIRQNAFAQPPAIILLEDGTVVREGSPSQIANPTSQISAQILPADPAERLHLAARAIADRCLYGVDINPMAVEMAKLSLWLITVDRERPFTFLDHALKCGDSLLGLSDARQLERFSLRPADAAQPLFDTANLWRHVQQAATLRRQLEATPSHTASQLVEKARLHREAETALAKLRAAADFLIAAELDTPGDRGWDTRRAIAASHMQAGWKKDIAEFQRLARAELRGRRPFHWPLEFPEVFDAGENGERPAGFDAFVGNPPFMGGQKITGELGTDYRDYLVEKIAGGQRGSADFCAYFFLRVHSLLNPVHGIAGLVATNTIAQGDSREVGLEQIAAAGALIPRAVPSCPWPGVAALEVAHVWFRRGSWAGVWTLDDKTVNGITAFLTEPGRASGKPFRLAAAAEKSFQGSIVLGMGFVLAPEQAAALIASDDRNRAVLFPYLSGKDFTSRPDISPSRWVINFHDWPLERTGEGSWLQASDKQRETWLRSGRVPSDYAESVAADFPDCLGIVERLVKPERADNNREVYRRYWWQYAEKRPALAQALRTSGGACFCSRVSAHHYFAVAEGVQVFSERLVVVVLPTLADFAVLSATIHDLWAHRPGQTTHETRNTYFNESAFETFPFPTDLSGLETIGERYHEHRRQLMLARGEGLTKTYNRFHDRGPDGAGADIAELRALHRQLDTAVAAAYGWPDLAANDGAALGHDFHATKQGTRHTLAPTARREILDRLLALNHTRHAEELAAGLHDKKKPKTKRAPAKPARGAAPQGELFQPPQPELF